MAKFAVEIISHRSLVAANGLDIDELPCKRNNVHGGENSRQQIDIGRQISDLRPQN